MTVSMKSVLQFGAWLPGLKNEKGQIGPLAILKRPNKFQNLEYHEIFLSFASPPPIDDLKATFLQHSKSPNGNPEM